MRRFWTPLRRRLMACAGGLAIGVAGLAGSAQAQAMTEVTFELKQQKSGRAEAQRLCAEQLRKQTWRDDLPSRLEVLKRSQNLLEMERAISPNDS